MNENIQQLIKQATKEERHYAGMSGYTTQEFNKEEFARLLILECMRVGRMAQIDSLSVSSTIAEHFDIASN